ncbi:MAG: hypothetical protein A2481_03795 [Candidatus Yonathbacteria bacterium RIFOXYC2_FULL_47_9]|nr:MAG: hypothetical protein A2481_03795 [Candidatus Yonathbacteria bacterium RIFOXYC2_FULL_47_9]HAT68252.1 hypothetical protein [Candidatus Yonathbacteria bacterium]
MHQMRFLKIIATSSVLVLLLPLFAFAQVSTTTAEQPDATDIARENAKREIQRMKDDLNTKYIDLIPKKEDARADSIREYLDVKTNPKNPGPSETIQVTIESYLTDLNKATISWSLNGRIVEQGAGKKTFSFKNGASGETTHLSVSIVTNKGERVVKELSWNPVGITIMWEANTYTPPFYKGKALMTPQALVRATAIPDSTGTRNALSASDLVYIWKKDGNAVSNASGYGKNSFSFLGPKPYGETKVSVQVSSTDDAVKSEMRVALPLTKPFILFYEDHPLLGVWHNRALSTSLNLTKKEFSVSAEPYFFSTEAGEAPEILYSWSLNSKPVTNISHGITLRNETGENGNSALSLTMRGLKKTFQTASHSLTIQFTAEESTRPTF